MHNPFDVQHRPYRGCRATTTRAVSCLHTGLNGPSLLLELIRIVHLQTFPIVITHMAHSRQTSQTAFSVKRECEAATAWCIYKTLPPVLVTGPLSPHLPFPFSLCRPVVKPPGPKIDRYLICTNTLRTNPTRLMHLKFWKSKSTSSSTTLPITAPYPPEKVEQDGEITGEGPIPLIIVEGFCGGAGDALWGDFADHLNAGCQDGRKRKTHFVK